VVITSNAEKELPDAFLRRCIFHYIAFPEPEQMAEIVRVPLPRYRGKALKARHGQILLDPRYQGPAEKAQHERTAGLAGGAVPCRIPTERIDAVPFLGVLLKKNEDVDAYEETRARKGVPSAIRSRRAIDGRRYAT
jgi:MoxR-like ATPase